MGAERRAVNADWNFINVVAVLVTKIKISRLREIDLVRRERELAPDDTPHLHVNFGAVKRRFVWNFYVIDSRTLQDIARHLFGLFPKLRFVDKFLSELRRIVR